MTETNSAEYIREIAYSFRQSRILLTAFELGIFSFLDEQKLSAEELAKQINTDSRATDRLMNALCGMGFLAKDNGTFSTTGLSSKFLVEGKPDFMGGLYHTNSLWDTWNYLTESVKEGTSHIGDQNKKEKDEWVEAFISAMHYRGVKQARQLAKMLDLSDTQKMLDIGGGSAAFSMEFVKNNPSMKAVVLDLPHVIPLTKKYVSENGLTNNFDFIEGNYLTADPGNGYDLIFLSAIVHINSYNQNKELVKKCVDALNDNGRVIISDFIMDEDRTKPVYGAFFSLNMLVGTACGDTYTEKEMREWFRSAGLSDIERKSTGFGADLMVGRK